MRVSSDLFLRSLGLSCLLGMAGCASTGFVTYSSPADWVAQTKNGAHLVLAEKADEWSEAKTYNGPSGSTLAVKSKFIKHYGTT